MGVTMSEPMTDKATERVKDNRFSVGASSMQGWRLSMEDAHTMFLELPGDKTAAFFAVFDGHGGSKVSLYASENLHRHIVDNDHYAKGDYIKALEQGFLSMDKELYEVYDTSAKLAGCTAICLLIVDNKVYCANVGDSRSVASINGKCVAMSYDHKPDLAVEYRRIAAAGGYIEANRVNGNLALSRAFGDFHYKCNELLPAQDQIVSPFPDIETIELNEELDFVLLACDGIWDVLTNEEVVDFVASRLEEEMEPGLICEQLMTRCLAPDCDLLVGCDNMTVVLLCYTRGLSYPDYCEIIWNRYSRAISVDGRIVCSSSYQLEQNNHSDNDAEDCEVALLLRQLDVSNSKSDQVKVSKPIIVSDENHNANHENHITVNEENKVPGENQVTSINQVSQDEYNQALDVVEQASVNADDDQAGKLSCANDLDASPDANEIASQHVDILKQNTTDIEPKLKLVDRCEDACSLSLESTQNKEII